MISECYLNYKNHMFLSDMPRKTCILVFRISVYEFVDTLNNIIFTDLDNKFHNKMRRNQKKSKIY